MIICYSWPFGETFTVRLLLLSRFQIFPLIASALPATHSLTSCYQFVKTADSVVFSFLPLMWFFSPPKIEFQSRVKPGKRVYSKRLIKMITSVNSLIGELSVFYTCRLSSFAHIKCEVCSLMFSEFE